MTSSYLVKCVIFNSGILFLYQEYIRKIGINIE